MEWNKSIEERISMKNQTLLKRLTILSLSAFLLSACGDSGEEGIDPPPEEEVDPPEEPAEPEEPDDEEPEEPQEPEVSQNPADWFPALENIHYVYDGEGSEYAPFEVISQYAEENAWQTLQITSGTSLMMVYEYTEDEIRQIHTREEVYYREDYINPWNPSYRDEQLDIILQAPIEVGHSWESPIGAEYEITDVNVEVETPSGVYEAIEVTRFSGGSGIVRYYAENVGLVQQTSIPEEDSADEIVSSLAEVNEDTPETIPMIFYTLDTDAMGIDQIETELNLYTNDVPRVAIADALKGGIPEMEEQPLLTEGVGMNYLYLDGTVVNVDFSEELISEMNAGAGIEGLILQSIVNTVGDYYSVDEVLLTVEGEPYSSGHIVHEEGQILPVDYTNVNPTTGQ